MNQKEKYDAFYSDGIYGPPTRRDWRRNPPDSWKLIYEKIIQIGAKTIIDIGCGNCTFISWLWSYGIACDGMDISGVGIEKFWPKDVPGKAYVGDVRDMPWISDCKYDFVRCFDVLEHLPDNLSGVRSAIYEVSRITNKMVALWSHNTYPSSVHAKFGPAHTFIRPQTEWKRLYKEQFNICDTVRAEGRKEITFAIPNRRTGSR